MGAVIGSLFGPEMDVDEDGRFELIISPESHPGNWIRSTPDTYRVTFRQFFADWEEEIPMDAEIECLTAPPGPPPILALDSLSEGLAHAVDWVRVSTNYWADTLDLWQAKPNEFFAFSEIETAKIDATPGGTPLISYWKVPPDEALIIRVTPRSAPTGIANSAATGGRPWIIAGVYPIPTSTRPSSKTTVN